MDKKSKLRNMSLLIPLAATCIFGIFAVLCIFQAKGIMSRMAEENLRDSFFLGAKLIENHMSFLKNISATVSSRTMLRKFLEDFQAGRMPEAEYIEQSRTFMNDSLAGTPDLAAIARIPLNGAGKVICGGGFPEEAFLLPKSEEFVLVPGGTKGRCDSLLLFCPVLSSQGKRIGTDIAVFKTERLKQIFMNSSLEFTPHAISCLFVLDENGTPRELFRTRGKKTSSPLGFLGDSTSHEELGLHGEVDVAGSMTMYKRMANADGPHIYMASTFDGADAFESVKENIMLMASTAVLLAILAYLFLFGFIRPCSETIQGHIGQIEALNLKLQSELDSHRKVEDMLKDSELRFRIFMDNIPGLIFLQDEEGRFTYINDYFRRKGISSGDDWIGRKKADVWPVDLSVEQGSRDGSLFPDSSFSSRVEVLTLNGKKSKFITYRFPVITENYRRSYGGVAFDISDVVKLEDELIRQRESLSLTLMSISDAVVVTDAGLKVSMVNKAATEIVGYPQPECLGRKVAEILHIYCDTDSPPLTNDILIDRLERQPPKKPFIIETKNGGKKLIEDSFAPVKDTQNRTIGYVFVFKDVTLIEKIIDKKSSTQNIENVGENPGGIANK